MNEYFVIRTVHKFCLARWFSLLLLVSSCSLADARKWSYLYAFSQLWRGDLPVIDSKEEINDFASTVGFIHLLVINISHCAPSIYFEFIFRLLPYSAASV